MTKKLVWFNDSILLDYADENFTSYYGNNQYLNRTVLPRFPDRPEMQWHIKLAPVAQRSITLVDQTGISKQFGDGIDLARVLTTHTNLPADFDPDHGALIDANFDLAAHKRVDEMYDQAERNGLTEIRISWSGGIDSNFVLAAIMMHPRSKPWLAAGRISVYTTMYARREDQELWDWVMQSGLPVHYLNYDQLGNDTGPWLLVTGEGEPYGTMFWNNHQKYIEPEDLRWGHWSKLETYFMVKDPSGLSWDYMKALVAASPIPIETCYHAWWWFEACVEGQNYLYRLSAYSDVNVIDPALVYPGGKTFWFLGSQDFADHGLYSVLNKKIPDEVDLVKPRLREFVARWQGWAEAKPKKRFYSQMMIPKRIRKNRIYDDLTWDTGDNLEEWCNK